MKKLTILTLSSLLVLGACNFQLAEDVKVSEVDFCIDVLGHQILPSRKVMVTQTLTMGDTVYNEPNQPVTRNLQFVWEIELDKMGRGCAKLDKSINKNDGSALSITDYKAPVLQSDYKRYQGSYQGMEIEARKAFWYFDLSKPDAELALRDSVKRGTGIFDRIKGYFGVGEKTGAQIDNTERALASKEWAPSSKPKKGSASSAVQI